MFELLELDINSFKGTTVLSDTIIKFHFSYGCIYKEKFIYSSFIIKSVLVALLVTQGVHIRLVLSLLPHQLLDHLLPNVQVLLVSVALDELPRVCVDLLFAHLLRKQLGQILSVIVTLGSRLLLLPHRVEPVQQTLVDARRVHLWLSLSWPYLLRNLMGILLAGLSFQELLNIIYLLTLPLHLLLLQRIGLNVDNLLLLLLLHFSLLLEVEQLGEPIKLVLEVHVL